MFDHHRGAADKQKTLFSNADGLKSNMGHWGRIPCFLLPMFAMKTDGVSPWMDEAYVYTQPQPKNNNQSVAITASCLLHRRNIRGQGATMAEALLLWVKKTANHLLWRSAGLGHQRFAMLDGIRATAVLWVLFLHLFLTNQLYGAVQFNESSMVADGDDINTNWRLIQNGDFGVDMFFVLSGFLIAHVLRSAANAGDANGQLSVSLVLRFWARRFLRIWPAVAVGVGLMTAVGNTSHGNELKLSFWTAYSGCHGDGWWRTLLFINNFFENAYWGLNGCGLLTWSVAIEFQFYMVSPLLVMLHLHNGKLAMACAALLACLCVLLRFLYMYSHDLPRRVLEEGGMSTPTTPGPSRLEFYSHLYQRPYMRMDAYFMGMLCYWAWLNHDEAGYNSNHSARTGYGTADHSLPLMEDHEADAVGDEHHSNRGRTSTSSTGRLVASVVCFVLGFTCAYIGEFSWFNRWTNLSTPPPQSAIGVFYLQMLLVRFTFSASLAGTIYLGLTDPTTIMARVWSSPLLYPVASVSYSAYLYQFTLFTFIVPPIADHFKKTDFVSYVVQWFATIPTILVVGFVAALVVEQPFMAVRPRAVPAK